MKDLSGNNSFSDESVKNSEDYLWDMYNEQKEIHKDNNLGPCYNHYVFDDDTINGYHYFHFKKNYDGNPEEFLDFYILKVFYFFQKKYYNTFLHVSAYPIYCQNCIFALSILTLH